MKPCNKQSEARANRYRELSLAYQFGVPERKPKKHGLRNRKAKAKFDVGKGQHKASDLLKSYAIKNIESATKSEKILWRSLTEVLPRHGLTLRFQYPVVRYILDFYIPEVSLGIEVDGPIHLGKAKQDWKRTKLLKRWGIRMIRFWNEEVEHDILRVLNAILTACGPAYVQAAEK